MNDWAVLDRSDPAPGDPEGTRGLGGRMLQEAQRTDESTGRLRSLSSGSGDLKMAGDYASGYLDTLGTLPVDLDKLGRAYRGCGSALNDFAGTLAEAKSRAGTALRQGLDAEIRYRSAIREMRNLLPGPQAAILGGGLSLSETTINLATTGLDEATREQVRVAARRARLADNDLDRARGLADQAAALREQGEDRCVKGINDALSDSGIKNKAWYEKAWDFVSAPFRSWDAFISLCGKVALVAGVAAMFISGPVGWALMAAALVAGAAIFANDLNKFSKGQIGIGGLAFSALGLIPGGRGVVSLARLGRGAAGLTHALASPGGARLLTVALRTGAGSLGRGMRNLGGAMPFALDTARGIRGAIKDPRLFARAFTSRFLGRDPIDLATGEMVMQMTDFELPGLLPLTLQRTYSSAYGVGRWFGPSWSSLLDQRLEVDSRGVCFAYSEAILLCYPRLAPGQSALPDEGPRLLLTRKPDGGFVVHDPESGRTMFFASPEADAALDAGPGVVLPVAAIGDRNGNRIDFAYDAEGMLAEIRHTGGYIVDVDTLGGRIAEFRLRGQAERPDVTIVRYEYDERGRLTEVINSSGLPLRFAYDSDNRIVSWRDRIGTWYRYTYDNAGRVVRTSGSAHCLDGEIRYDPENRVSIEVNSLGAETVRHFNEAWQVERVVDPLGQVTVHQWDRYDRKLAETDPLGNTTRFAYDQAGNLAEVTRPDGLRTRVEYNNLHQPTLVTQPDGGQWRHEFDRRGNLLAVTDPAGTTTRYFHGDRGALLSVSDALGHTTRYRCDAAGLPIAVTDPLRATTTAQRDGFGRVVALIDPLGNATRFDWTVEGKQASEIRPDGGTQIWRYDGEGNLIEHVDALGQSTRIEQTYFDLPAVRTAPDGSRVAYTYDTELRLTSVTDAKGQTWRYEYDLAGRLVREVDYDGRVLRYAYDASGRLIKRVNGAGEMIELDRDELGQVVRRRSGSAVTTLSYDAQGRITRAVNPDADVEFERDRLGRVLAETINGRMLACFYDVTGRRVARRTPSGVESRWEYDAAGRPAALRIDGRVLEFEHDAAGREVARRFGRATLAQGWDSSSRLVSQTLFDGRPLTQEDAVSTRKLQERNYSYRADGYVTGIDDRLAGRRSYDVDGCGQVTAVTGTGWSERYDYDPAGNIINAVGPNASERSETGRREFTGSRISRAGNLHYEHDAQGRITLRRQRLLSGGSRSWRYSWDAEDRLTGVTTPDGVRWRYQYDALGRRIAKQRLDQDHRVVEQVDFCWDGALLAEQSVTQPGRVRATTTWDWEPDGVRPLVQVDDKFHAIVTDLVGTPTELVNQAGEVLAQDRVSLWDALAPDSPCPLRFPGQYHDPETGFYYNVFRHYDPHTGAYGSVDPMGLEPGVNARRYVSNPQLFCDPLGLAPYAGKPVNLPSWRKIGIDIDHIVSGHTAGGSRVSPLKDLFTAGMSKQQIANVVRQAYRHASVAGPSQGERVFLAGAHDGVTYEMWVNKATKMIESAWPKY